MPKKVDHHVMRTQLADAVVRVAARRGVVEVSLRHVGLAFQAYAVKPDLAERLRTGTGCARS